MIYAANHHLPLVDVYVDYFEISLAIIETKQLTACISLGVEYLTTRCVSLQFTHVLLPAHMFKRDCFLPGKAQYAAKTADMKLA